jgi:beta-1,4-mannosyltransferase
MQNPPSIPALFTVWLVAFFRKSQVVVDWHNFGYSMLGLKLGDRHKMVAYAKMYEKWFGRRSTVNLTVTDAMAKKLKRDFKITAPVITVHDRPGPDFEPLDNDERLQFLNLLPETASHIEAIKKGRLKVLVSSTSWTPDEDFSLLLDALVGYSQLATSSHPHIPELLVIITGKGPLKEKYVAQIAELKAKGQLEMVEVKTAWFSISYYAALLGAADIGISLHTSSSGVDLPMKVLDMFGAGLPVLGWSDFEAWPELGKEGVNSRGFKNAKELETALVELLGPDGTELKTLKAGAIEESKRGWEDEWKSTVGKLLDAC